MIDMIMNKVQQHAELFGTFATRFDIQFNRKTLLYSARVWFADDSVVDIKFIDGILSVIEL